MNPAALATTLNASGSLLGIPSLTILVLHASTKFAATPIWLRLRLNPAHTPTPLRLFYGRRAIYSATICWS